MPLTPGERAEKIMEQLASIEHDRWGRWHRYAREEWTPKNIARWNDLALRLYEELSEEIKEKDREEVRHYLPLIVETIREAEQSVWLEAAQLAYDCRATVMGPMEIGDALSKRAEEL